MMFLKKSIFSVVLLTLIFFLQPLSLSAHYLGGNRAISKQGHHQINNRYYHRGGYIYGNNSPYNAYYLSNPNQGGYYSDYNRYYYPYYLYPAGYSQSIYYYSY